MRFEISIEVLDARTPASAWVDAYGDDFVARALSHGAVEWHWHRHAWGVVLDLAFPDEIEWERFLADPVVRAWLDAIPDPVNGLIIQRGWGGTSGSSEPRRPKPIAGAGAAEVPLPEADEIDDVVPADDRRRTLVASGPSARPQAVPAASR